MSTKKTCTECLIEGGREDSGFRKGPTSDGYRNQCRACERDAKREQRRRDREHRMSSNYESLKPEDFDVSVGNDGNIDKEAAAQRRQEYSRAMGEFADELAMDDLSGESGAYIAKLAEQERRFGNRRLARSVSLAAAHEALALRQFKQAATQYLADKVTPIGYALRKHDDKLPRTVVLHLSDLHLGADLKSRDNPIAFGPVEEARRLEYVIRQALDYKPQYRETSELLVLLNGDVIEGLLMHDWRDGAPLTEQKVIFWRHLSTALGLLAQVYKRVHVECQPGNHGRDKIRHPGRATSSKWDGHEWQMYWALREMCRGLLNVTWSIPFRGYSVVDLYGAKMLMTHGDTEIKLGDPDTKADANMRQMEAINSDLRYGVRFDVAVFGHFHKCRVQPGRVRLMFNGALIPPNGHARTMGYAEPCRQLLWEAVEGHPVGDLRIIEVGRKQDEDEKLGTLIRPFRFDMDGF